jgi:hypothetical protein
MSTITAHKNEPREAAENAAEQPEPAIGDFKVCILQHKGAGPAPGKTVALDKAGELKKITVPWRERFFVGDVNLTLKDLYNTLTTPLGPEYHLTGGTCGYTISDDPKDTGAIAVSKRVLDRAAEGVDPFAPLIDAETGQFLTGFSDEYLKYRLGPGLMVIDSDRLKQGETPVSDQMRAAVPGIENYARIEAPSSSSYIYDAAGTQLAGLKGLHTFYGVVDATDIPRALDVVHKRLILSGFAKFSVGDAGDILERSAVDLSMKKPSQPVYAGAATMLGGLVSKRTDNTTYHEGKPLLDTRKVILDLTPKEERECAAKVEAARAPLLEEAAAKKAAHREKLALDKIKNSGGEYTLEAALAAVNRSLAGGFLAPEHEILMADGRVVTVADILANPKEFYLRNCRDPHEWAYGSDTVAQVRREGGQLCIKSFAHGKHTLMLGEPPTAEEALAMARQDFGTPEAMAYLNDPEVQRIMSDAVAAAHAAATPTWVRDMNARYAFISGEGASGNMCLLEFFPDGAWKQIEHRLAEKTHANDMVDVGDKNGAPALKNRLAAWLKHPARRSYLRGIAFLPGKPREWEGYFNTWGGWGVEPLAGPWPNIEAHLRDILCGGDTDVFDYFMGWLASRVQNPEGVMGVVPVFRGEQGCGKSMVAEWLKKVFGDACMATAHSDDIVGKFNPDLGNKNLVICEEAFFAGDPSFRGKLKALITEPTLRVEGKFLPSRRVRNHLGMIWLTNETHSAPAEVGDRRFFVVECGPKRNQGYYVKLVAAAECELPAFFHHLLTRDLKAFTVQAFPKTAARADQIGKNLTGLNRFGMEMLERGRFPKGCSHDFGGDIFKDWDTQPICIPKDDVRDAISDFMRQHDRGRLTNDREVKALVEAMAGQEFRPKATDADRKRVWRIPPRSQAREAFEEKLGMTPKQPR